MNDEGKGQNQRFTYFDCFIGLFNEVSVISDRYGS